MDLISIVIGCYNGAEFIEDTINNCLNQTYKNIEVVVVDNGSKDDSVKIIESIKSDKLVVFKREGGSPSCSKNTGIDIAKGKYVTFVDADDAIENDYVEKMFNAVEDGVLPCALITEFIGTIDNTIKTHDHPKGKMNINKYTSKYCRFIFGKLFLREYLTHLDVGYLWEDNLWVPMISKNYKKALTVNARYFYRKGDTNSITSHKIPFKKAQDSLALLEERYFKTKMSGVCFSMRTYLVARFPEKYNYLIRNKKARKKLLKSKSYGLKTKIFKILLFFRLHFIIKKIMIKGG